MTKKSTRARRNKSSSNTAPLLLLCFVIATVSVAIALRQLILERRLSEQLAAETAPITSKLVGNYSVTRPGPDGRTTTITLTLDANRRLLFTTTSPDASYEGQWSGDSNGTIITTINAKNYAFSYLPDGAGALRILNPDLELWGAATVTLTRD